MAKSAYWIGMLILFLLACLGVVNGQPVNQYHHSFRNEATGELVTAVTETDTFGYPKEIRLYKANDPQIRFFKMKVTTFMPAAVLVDGVTKIRADVRGYQEGHSKLTHVVVYWDPKPLNRHTVFATNWEWFWIDEPESVSILTDPEKFISVSQPITR